MSNLVYLHPIAEVIKPTNATNDEQLVNVWLGNRPSSTVKTYRIAAEQFLDFLNKPIRAIVLEDLHRWCDHLNSEYKQTTVKNKVSAIKSLLTFACRANYTRFNVGIALKARKPWQELSQRILSRDEVKRLIAAGKTERDRTIMETLYRLGLRINELYNLTWDDFRLKPDGAAVATIRGKGEKTRHINVPANLYGKLITFKTERSEYLFLNYRGTRLSKQAIDKIIKAAAAKAELGKKVSAHWLRHAHASHSLDAGCDLNLLKSSLGHASLNTTQVYLHCNPDRSSSQYLDL